jgi:hypothetical protein
MVPFWMWVGVEKRRGVLALGEEGGLAGAPTQARRMWAICRAGAEEGVRGVQLEKKCHVGRVTPQNVTRWRMA